MTSEREVKELRESVRALKEELGQSASAASLLACELQDSREALSLLESKLRRADVELVDLKAELNDLFLCVSHDLKAPLRAVSGFSAMLLEDYHESLGPDGAELLGRIQRSVVRMTGLIDGLLALSRAARTDMLIKQLDLSRVSGEVIADMQSLHPARNVDVTVQEAMTCFGDSRLMRSVMQNLLGNAWKFTVNNPQASIEVGEECGESGRTFVVRDNGVGFDMAYADRLFVPFQRLHTDDEFPGTGVGLSIVRRIVRRHGGDVWAESEIGKGATFYFTIGTVGEAEG